MFLVLLTLVIVALGLKYRDAAYWKRAVPAIVVLWAMQLLAAGGGTLEDPTGDGVLTRWVRQATHDGALVAVWGLGVLVLGYGVTFWLVRKGIAESKAAASSKGSPT